MDNYLVTDELEVEGIVLADDVDGVWIIGAWVGKERVCDSILSKTFQSMFL